MLNTFHPYWQASGDQIIHLLDTLAGAYTKVAIIIGAMLLVLLVWLCIAELQQSKKLHRATRKPPMDEPRRPSGRERGYTLIKESSS